MITVTTRADYAAACAGRTRAVVMTMGALHEGHTTLMRAAREEIGPDGLVVATVFVNPLQFGPGEDFDRYPRTLDADTAACREAGVDVLLAPDVAEVYPRWAAAADAVTPDPGPLGDRLEGASRPGHFRGMLTVVAKLLHITAADIALFGEKDYQQLTLIRSMVDTLDFPVRVVGVPTVRESDGLAMSSRNRYLDPGQRHLAAAIPTALTAAVTAANSGADASTCLTAAQQHLTGLDVDYLVITDSDMGPIPPRGPARILTAVRVGTTRLLDNMPLHLNPNPNLNPDTTGATR